MRRRSRLTSGTAPTAAGRPRHGGEISRFERARTARRPRIACADRDRPLHILVRVPIYEYRCENGHTFEVLQSMSDDPVTLCEVCSEPVQRVFHPVAVHFKGSGFYSTDYGRNRGGGRDDGSKSESSKESTTSTSEGSSSSSSSKSESGGSQSGSSSSSD